MWCIISTFSGLCKFYQKPVAKIAKRLGYSESNILILEGKELELQKKYPSVYQSLLTCSQNKDKRTYLEYAKDLVSAWTFEDYLVEKFRLLGEDLRLAGADKERKILVNAKTSSSSDTVYVYDNYRLKVEIVNDYTGFWYKAKKIHLRNHKYEHLKQENSVLVGVDTVNKKYIIIDFSLPNLNIKKIEAHKPFGGKQASEIDLESISFKDFQAVNIAQDLKQIIKNRKG